MALPPKAFDLLVDLVEHAGHLREKKQLMEALWPDTFVEEVNLAYTVSALRKALGDTREHAEFIETVPTRGYRFVGSVNRPASDAAASDQRQVGALGAAGLRHARIWVTVLVALAIAACTWAFLRFFHGGGQSSSNRILTVTNNPGLVRWPSLSPDGNWVAFEWKGEKQNNWDVYVKEVDGTGFARLTSDPAPDFLPRWSPDGHQVAFLRGAGDRWALYVMSALGGGERRLADASLSCCLNWSPDGTHIVLSDRARPTDPWSIWVLSLETLQKTQLTHPPPGTDGDMTPAYSPDGGSLAFARSWAWSNRSAIEVMRLPDGAPRFLTDHHRPGPLAWTADGREIVFATTAETQPGLWRIAVDGGEPQRIPLRGDFVAQPTVRGTHLAYLAVSGNSDIWRLDLSGPLESLRPSTALVAWPSNEYHPRISPDGRKIAFPSSSSGNLEIWVTGADGSSPQRITDLRVPNTGSPDWSPDGKWIAFDSVKSGNDDLYVVSAEGGPVRRLTTDTYGKVAPRWSRDGRSIYFDSFREGRWQVWKMPTGGGPAVQVTKGGGTCARESPDGRFVYYYGGYRQERKGVWRVPVSGGRETLVLDEEIDVHKWDVTARGIYFLAAGFPETLSFFDFASGEVTRLAQPCDRPGCWLQFGLSVAPDGTWLLYCGGFYSSHIMMIDDFK